MPKATALTPAVLDVPQVTPLASTPARGDRSDRVLRRAPPPANDKPLQIRLPRAQVKAIKLAAAEAEQTISEFMLACFQSYMKTTKKA
jgi:hypothetical protein